MFYMFEDDMFKDGPWDHLIYVVTYRISSDSGFSRKNSGRALTPITASMAFVRPGKHCSDPGMCSLVTSLRT